ncbi:MAG TPA: hypothetical protein VID48_11925 [Solirubrobacteraceae bacterium]|jgi:hypothetical protein
MTARDKDACVNQLIERSVGTDSCSSDVWRGPEGNWIAKHLKLPTVTGTLIHLAQSDMQRPPNTN